jgi:pyruvate/2-oxoglutarate dehydrogenase complex dihydrolipoamide dehydrogenase (E3) component
MDHAVVIGCGPGSIAAAWMLAPRLNRVTMASATLCRTGLLHWRCLPSSSATSATPPYVSANPRSSVAERASVECSSRDRALAGQNIYMYCSSRKGVSNDRRHATHSSA